MPLLSAAHLLHGLLSSIMVWPAGGQRGGFCLAAVWAAVVLQVGGCRLRSRLQLV